MFWILYDLQTFFIATPVGSVALVIFVLFGDQLFLLPRQCLVRAIWGRPQPSKETLPDGLLVIPSLLRGADELEAIKATVSNVIQNDYPGRMLVVASIDGWAVAPKLYADLHAWFATKQQHLPKNVWLYVTGTPERRGKPLAIEHGVRFVEGLVAEGAHAQFPKIYFSTDADADLGPNALEHLARRLCKKGFFSGNPGRAVAGNLHVRDEQYWRGWKHFFSLEGQLTLQVARDYMTSNMMRFNVRPMPISGVPGALYCTWTDILLAGPKYMGFMRSLTLLDCVKWWLGKAPPKFSTSDVAPIPELLAGDTDDTVSAFLALMARWENGVITFDAPRTPLHALFYALRTLFLDRGLRYEPEAHVYTASPSTIGALWRQRMRWNASRIEVAGRFSKSFRYHWDLSAATVGTVGLMLKCLFFSLFAYFAAPLTIGKTGVVVPLAVGLAVALGVDAVSTVLALLIDGSFVAKWRLLLAIPVATLYKPVYGFWAGAAGMLKDVFLVGNCTKFAPEETLIKGGSNRIALFSRVRRAAILTLRAAIYGDVPLGAFWLGWGETPWTPSGFKGWTTGKRPSLYERLRHGAERPIAPAVEVAAATPQVVAAPMLAEATYAAPRSSVVPMRPSRMSIHNALVTSRSASVAPPSQRAA